MEELILRWADNRGILKHGTVSGQTEKLKEELQELLEAQDLKNIHEIADAIGDMQVVLIILAELHGLSAADCLRDAYNIINARKGKMVNGVFVKENAA
jgi:NTP pyrophosphatase (non-canonical NTP hydrolase)